MNWMRSSQSCERLSALAMLNIHRDVKLDISEIKNLYKVKHPLKFEQLVKRKKFIHFFWNIIAILLEFQNHYFKQGYLSFLVKSRRVLLSTQKFSKNVSMSINKLF